MGRRIVLEPGYTTSKFDRDIHYVPESELRRLYNVPATAYVIALRNPQDFAMFVELPGDVRLKPARDYYDVQQRYPDLRPRSSTD